MSAAETQGCPSIDHLCALAKVSRAGFYRFGEFREPEGPGRVARPFGSALTDPGVRLSRTRLFPRVTRIVSPLCP